MTNFLDNYVAWATPLTETPPQFHYYIAYAILSHVIGRKVTYSGADYNAGPNLWFVFIGPSSMSRKSTALKLALRLLNNVYEDKKWLLPSQGSKESFFDAWKQNLEEETGTAKGLLVYDEFDELMNHLNKKYNAGLLGDLTSCYDQSPFRNRIGRGEKAEEIFIPHPYLNIVCASTIDWFYNNLDAIKVKGGFLPRFNLIYADQKPSHKRLIPRRPKPNLELEVSLVNELKAMINSSLGEFGREIEMDYTREAGEIYDKFYYKTMEQSRKLNNPYMAPFFTRRLADTHKFALINAIINNHQPHIQTEDVQHAVGTIRQILEHTTHLITDKMTFNQYQRDRDEILTIIKSRGDKGILHSDALKYSKMKARYFGEITDSLLQEESIRKQEEGVSFPEHNRKKITYFAENSD